IACGIILRPQQFKTRFAADSRVIIVGFNKAVVCARLRGCPPGCLMVLARRIYHCDLEAWVLQVQRASERTRTTAVLYEYNLGDAFLNRSLCGLQQELSRSLVQLLRNAADHPHSGN